jgi:hypothetical protein
MPSVWDYVVPRRGSIGQSFTQGFRIGQDMKRQKADAERQKQLDADAKEQREYQRGRDSRDDRFREEEAGRREAEFRQREEDRARERARIEREEQKKRDEEAAIGGVTKKVKDAVDALPPTATPEEVARVRQAAFERAVTELPPHMAAQYMVKTGEIGAKEAAKPSAKAKDEVFNPAAPIIDEIGQLVTAKNQGFTKGTMKGGKFQEPKAMTWDDDINEILKEKLRQAERMGVDPAELEKIIGGGSTTQTPPNQRRFVVTHSQVNAPPALEF